MCGEVPVEKNPLLGSIERFTNNNRLHRQLSGILDSIFSIDENTQLNDEKVTSLVELAQKIANKSEDQDEADFDGDVRKYVQDNFPEQKHLLDKIRQNVSMVIVDQNGNILITTEESLTQPFSFPQGGIDNDLSAEETAKKEYTEEINYPDYIIEGDPVVVDMQGTSPIEQEFHGLRILEEVLRTKDYKANDPSTLGRPAKKQYHPVIIKLKQSDNASLKSKQDSDSTESKPEIDKSRLGFVTPKELAVKLFNTRKIDEEGERLPLSAKMQTIRDLFEASFSALGYNDDLQDELLGIMNKGPEDRKRP